MEHSFFFMIGFWVIGAVIAGCLASLKGLSFWAAFFISLFLSPLFGFFFFLMLPGKKEMAVKDIALTNRARINALTSEVQYLKHALEAKLATANSHTRAGAIDFHI